MASVELKEMLAAAVAACEDKKAEDLRILALDPAESGLTDYFLICTGTNDRQTVAITDEIEIRLKRDFATYPNSVEGRKQGEWILMDYVDFIVHVFLPEKRAFYGLERLRKSATTLSVNDLNAEIKAAIRAKRPAKSSSTVAASTPDAPTSSSKRGKAKLAAEPAAASETLPASPGLQRTAMKVAKSAAKKSSAKRTTAKQPTLEAAAPKTTKRASSRTGSPAGETVPTR